MVGLATKSGAFVEQDARPSSPGGAADLVLSGSVLELSVCVPSACLRAGHGDRLWRSLQLAALSGSLGSLGHILQRLRVGQAQPSFLFRLPPWQAAEAKLLLGDRESITSSAIVHSLAGEDCADSGLTVEVGKPLPAIYVGDECLRVLPGFNLCEPKWQHIEVPVEHAIARCLEAMQVEPVEFFRHLGSHTATRSHMRECQQRGFRVYWILQVTGASWVESRTLSPDQVSSSFTVCVPAECEAYPVGVWISPSIVLARGRTAHGHFHDSRMRRLSSICRPDHIRLPARSAFPVADDANIRVALGNLSQRIFRLVYMEGGKPKVNGVIIAEQRFPQPPSAPSRLVSAPAGVALLFGGSWRFGYSLAKPIRQHVVEPLGASVFAVMSLGMQWRVSADAPENVAAELAEAEFTDAFGEALTGFKWVKDPVPGDLARELSTSGVLDIHILMGGWDVTPLSSKAGTSLHAYRKIEAVLDLAERHEETVRSRRFEWLVFSRTDLIWAADHPPLALLEPNAVWSMGGQDWHAAIPRGLSDAWFRRWSALASGVAPMMPGQNPGLLLMNMLEFSNVSVCSFPQIASLASCTNWSCYAWTSQGDGNWRWPTQKRRIMLAARGLRSGRLAWSLGHHGLPVIGFQANGSATGRGGHGVALGRVVATSMRGWRQV